MNYPPYSTAGEEKTVNGPRATTEYGHDWYAEEMRRDHDPVKAAFLRAMRNTPPAFQRGVADSLDQQGVNLTTGERES